MIISERAKPPPNRRRAPQGISLRSSHSMSLKTNRKIADAMATVESSMFNFNFSFITVKSIQSNVVVRKTRATIFPFYPNGPPKWAGLTSSLIV